MSWFERGWGGVLLVVLFMCFGMAGLTRAEFVGADEPASFSLCEQPEDATGRPRSECQAGDIRFQSDTIDTGYGGFGFSVATGHLNADDRVDLVVGDPESNRVYVFFGRLSSKNSYDLVPGDLDREVSIDDRADLILSVGPGSSVGSLGFSVAIGHERIEDACPEGGAAAAMLIGAPGLPGTTSTDPGTVFYLASGALCLAPTDPATPVTLDLAEIGQAFQSPDAEQDDEFGYAVTFGRLLTNTGDEEDVIIGARGVNSGAGRVSMFPILDGLVDLTADSQAEIEGQEGEGLGEVLAVGDLDRDFDSDLKPHGNADDLAIGAVGHENGKVVLVQGPLAPDGGLDGVYEEGLDPEIQSIIGEAPGDFFGFSVAVSGRGDLAIGAVFADNLPPDGGTGDGGNVLTNVGTAERINAGKVYFWNPGILGSGGSNLEPDAADRVLVARRSGDQLGFAISFGNLDGSGEDNLIVTARREDGSSLKVDEIDQGTVYVIFDPTSLASPVDLNACDVTSDCTGVAGIDVMIFGGDRTDDRGDEIGFAVATGNFNDDNSADLFVSTVTQNRVYVVTLEDTDDDRVDQGRNIRDDDDDGDGDADATDCAPLDAEFFSGADEIACNDIDENCNGMEDDVPDFDEDGFDACGTEEQQADCDDEDSLSYPDAPELCDGNDNACSGSVPADERDLDDDTYVECTDWDDTQDDDPDIVDGNDCRDVDSDTFPGAAANEVDPIACMQDADGDDFGDLAPPSGVTAGTDCDDNSHLTFPGAAANEVDPTACMRDEDEDGYGDDNAPETVTSGTDCDDSDPIANPGAVELCDGNDNTCVGAVSINELDTDGDGYVGCSGWIDVQGDDPGILAGEDCNAQDGTTFPGAAPNETDPTACMKDSDGDDYGDLAAPAGVAPGTDCDDGSAVTFLGAAEIEAPLNCMKDGDDDGYGDSSATLPVAAGDDCDDDDPSRYSGAPEIPDDGIDQGCNGFDTVTCFVDDDFDGFGGPTELLADDGDCSDPGESQFDTDCDDTDNGVSPDAAEIPEDGVDQDCNGFDAITCTEDADGDGFGTTVGTTTVADDGSCDPEENESTSSDDCDDDDPYTFPGAPERCDGNANACGTPLPEDETDLDGDGHVACSGWDDTQADDPGIAGGDDCDETDVETFAGAAPNEVLAAACMTDRDGDDYGDLAPPAGITPGTDCDDDSAVTFPGAAAIDGPLNCMRDADGDDYGDVSTALPVVAGTDCHDADPVTHPGATELCDGNDNACGGSVPADEIDLDDDGYVACDSWDDIQGDDPSIAGGNDCDAIDPDTFPGAAPSEVFAGACMRDRDGDDYGDLVPPAGVVPGSDCDDDSPVTFLGAAEIEAPLNCMKDGDDDGFGDETASLPVVAGTDCDDDELTTFPGAPENPLDGIDQDCDGTDLLDCFVDADLDGFGGTITIAPDDGDCSDPGESPFDTDCDDAIDTIFPGAPETSDDGVDQDCNGADTITCFVDADQDTFGTDLGTTTLADDGSCDVDQQESSSADDCDDFVGTVFPGAAEIADDGVDQNCNGADTVTCFVDADQDGFGTDLGTTTLADDGSCDAVQQESSSNDDCDDGDDTIFPDAPEFPNDGIDQNCDGADSLLCFTDGDLDGFGGTDSFVPGDGNCDDPGESLLDTDCNDADETIFPGAAETPDDGLDQDCSGADTVSCFVDADQDGFGTDLGTTTLADDGSCDTAERESPSADDCDDAADTVFPGASEIPADGIDQDCNGLDSVSCFVDSDLDGFGSSENLVSEDQDCTDPGESANDTDCDDTADAVFPGAPEISDDGIDQDCSGSDTVTCFVDADRDGFGTDLDTTTLADDGSCDTVQQESNSDDDCDDADDTIFPGALEIPGDGVDQNCDGIDQLICFIDADLDGFGSTDTLVPDDDDCIDPGESPIGTDCDDDEDSVFPGAPETPDDGVDQDCSGADTVTCILDVDQDGFGTELGTIVLANDGSCDSAQQESPVAGDCDDNDPNSRPNAPELCDGNDNACTGAVPGGEIDPDGDTWVACTGWNDTQGDDPGISGGGDCGALDGDAFPGAAPNEVFSGACMKDRDGDDYGDIAPPIGVTQGTDCDDDSPTGASTFRGAAEIEAPLNCMKDADDDGYGDSAVSLPVVAGTDCADDESAANPGASEGPSGDPTCSDTLDNDCDSFVDGADSECAAPSVRRTGFRSLDRNPKRRPARRGR